MSGIILWARCMSTLDHGALTTPTRGNRSSSRYRSVTTTVANNTNISADTNTSHSRSNNVSETSANDRRSCSRSYGYKPTAWCR